MLALNLVLAFCLELAALIALGLWGYALGPTPFLRVLLALVVPILPAVFWGAFLSPKAPLPLTPQFTLLAKFIVFGVAAFAFWRTGYSPITVVFTLLAALHTLYLSIATPPSAG